VFIIVVFFIIDSVRKLLDTASYIFLTGPPSKIWKLMHRHEQLPLSLTNKASDSVAMKTKERNSRR